MKSWALALVLGLALPAVAQEELPARQKAIIRSMSHWALVVRADTEDPQLAQLAKELGVLRGGADQPLGPDGVQKLQSDFDAWKDRVSGEFHQRKLAVDPAWPGNFRQDFEKGVNGLARMAEAADQRKVAAARASRRVALLEELVSPAAFDYYIERSKKGGAGALAAARAVGKDWEGDFFAGYAPRASELRPEAAKAPPSPGADHAALRKRLLGFGMERQVVDAIFVHSQAQGVDPVMVAAVAAAESGGRAHVTSRCGARGAMQVMPGTGRGLGVKNPRDLYDPMIGVRAGVRYLKDRWADFARVSWAALQSVNPWARRDVKMAIAAYNAGPGAVRKYGRVPPYRETQRYVVRVLRYYDEFKRSASLG